ncbi:hypothetical protein DFH06DRAFT_1305092 [Mycena polygramma]|nr:hypothetical protein DFH06DRAFT_1305092 [Mycena polygramma]
MSDGRLDSEGDGRPRVETTGRGPDVDNREGEAESGATEVSPWGTETGVLRLGGSPSLWKSAEGMALEAVVLRRALTPRNVPRVLILRAHKVSREPPTRTDELIFATYERCDIVDYLETTQQAETSSYTKFDTKVATSVWRAVAPRVKVKKRTRAPTRTTMSRVILRDWNGPVQELALSQSYPSAMDLSTKLAEMGYKENSFDQCSLTVSNVDDSVFIATLPGTLSARNQARKEEARDLSSRRLTIAFRRITALEEALLQERRERLEDRRRNDVLHLEAFQDMLDRLEEIVTVEVVDRLIRSLNDIIFNTSTKSRWDRCATLSDKNKAALQHARKSYIIDLYNWRPTTLANIALQVTAMACLTPDHRRLLDALMAPRIRSMSRSARNKLQPPVPSKQTAKNIVPRFDLTPQELAGVERWIDNTGEPIDNSGEPFFQPDSAGDRFIFLHKTTEDLRISISATDGQLASL